MKKTVIATLLILASGTDVDASVDYEDIYHYLDNRNFTCGRISDVSTGQYGNIVVYDIVCDNDKGHSIYQYAPEQLVQTYYLED